MARSLRTIDPERLRRLRDLVKSSQPQPGQGMPWEQLTELALEAQTMGGITIDYRAVPDLGFPMVILHSEKEAGDELDLTPREVEVARLIAEGLSNKEIAQRLGITLLTAKDHVHRILEKTGLPNRAAVAAAIRS